MKWSTSLSSGSAAASSRGPTEAEVDFLSALRALDRAAVRYVLVGQLAEGLVVMVASLVDLIRIAEASEDRLRVPALRRTLGLATSLPAGSAADAA